MLHMLLLLATTGANPLAHLALRADFYTPSDPAGRCAWGTPSPTPSPPRTDGCYLDAYVGKGDAAHAARIAALYACNDHAKCYADCGRTKTDCDAMLRVALYNVCGSGEWQTCDFEAIAAEQMREDVWADANLRHCPYA
ncbi:hypothetical protein CC85DRAFT_304052 [Cutaneotrichosporon oleaginosum]|uniref:Uncharacterized protein n=1 Tax=Cutaneotrichosporon oleaginosum TaxID=879819 RepID=A0A0J0XHC5_9TREE|nr:uncharacterized protein CC85DRAFT_304052 [Cutaneotrichosporon oleaginosum]KLT40525.1 hypothetical protein CC85DRAFT_304052 [Cutaneotrichosporon oleaginosum]TXT08404.1 hypothetical protein COLE_05328 [Cutaneotrichosporon oleaginosum]